MSPQALPARVFDLLVVGGGPAGQKAAIQAAKAGRRVLLVDREAAPGGECVRRGTIPSKTLRETALHLSGLRQRAAGLHCLARSPIDAGTKLANLMARLDAVVLGHEHFLGAQLSRNGIEFLRGNARFDGPGRIFIDRADGRVERVAAQQVVLATGSRPRQVPGFHVDGHNIVDSDSILTLEHLPNSLLVLGGGVIACEFATVFQALDVAVTIVDRAERPLAFLDREIGERFTRSFQAAGGTLVPAVDPVGVELAPTADGRPAVRCELKDGREFRADVCLLALGRRAALENLGLETIDLAPNGRGFLEVDEFFRTKAPGVYAVGDVIGPPSLATSAMEQGRRAALHALGLPQPGGRDLVPIGVYTIPELASVGLCEAEARERGIPVRVGRARFHELARGQINGALDGLLKMVTDAEGHTLLGVQVVGENAAEIVHLGQIAMLGNLGVHAFVDHVFNFPTYAEAYRVAALDVLGQCHRARTAA